MAFRLQLLDHPVHGFYHHDHAGIAAITVVVHVFAWADPVFPQVVDVDFHQAFLDGASNDRVAQRALEQFGDDGKDIDSHKQGLF